MLLGASDTGKTTLAHAIHSQWLESGRAVAYLDCDVGQGSLGPPALLALQTQLEGDRSRRRFYFIGDTTPRGNFLPVIVGAAHLLRMARLSGAQDVVVDTTGLVAPEAGGTMLKLWKVEALRPDYVVALERQDELSQILGCLGHTYGDRLIVASPQAGVVPRSQAERAAGRNRRWRAYFLRAAKATLPYAWADVWERGLLAEGRLLGLDTASGLCAGMAVMVGSDVSGLEVLTPLKDLRRIARVRPGRVRLDPSCWCELPRD